MSEEKKRLDVKLLKIAEHLPGEWTLDHKFDKSFWYAQLVDGEGHGVGAFIRRNNNRLEIDGSWPMDKREVVFAPSNPHKITADFDREPAAIASDIKRRFLPLYLKLYAEQSKRAADADAFVANRTTLFKELAAIIEVKLRRYQERIIDFGTNHLIEVNAPDSVRIDLRCLDAKKAKAILRAVKRILSK